MEHILTEICSQKIDHVVAQKEKVTRTKLYKQIKNARDPRGFLKSLNFVSQNDNFAIIAEIKKASPSNGTIRENFNPGDLAKSYEMGGATCLSVLTDVNFFRGADSHLQEVLNSSILPIIRKDFILDEYQVIESRALGADCILLIMACLDDRKAKELKLMSDDLGMDTLVEIHDERELERALKLSPAILGINNRNLKTLEVDLSNTENLAAMIDKNITIVSESGLKTYDDLMRMKKVGVHCFLIGEALMVEENIEIATKRMLGK